jgi:hypothetical protein
MTPMLYEVILPYLNASPFFQKLSKLIGTKQHYQIHHLNQSARALVTAHLWKETGKNILIVSQDDLMAEDLWMTFAPYWTGKCSLSSRV